MAQGKQERVKKIYEFAKDNVYFCLPDIKIGDLEANTNLLFEIFSCLNNGKQMLMGPYGLGKTTSSENVITLIHGLPKEIVLAAEVRGHPEQTEEKMIARPDLGELNLGREKVLWSYFVLNAPKILDELNRLPPSKQNIILDGIDRGNWKYLSDLVQNGEFTLFATCNPEDKGNGVLIEPVLDRFDIATESKKPGIIEHSSLKDIPKEKKKILNGVAEAQQIAEIYNDKTLSYKEKLEKTEKITEDYKNDLKKKTGLELLTKKELGEIADEIKAVPFTNDADLFYTFIISELTSCQQFGMKRTNDSCPEGCHYIKYACGKINNGISVRTTEALAKYARTLAWYTEEKVGIEHLEKILPYVIWHKINFKEEYINKMKNEARTDPAELYAAKQLVKEIKARFVEQMPMISNYVCLRRDGKDKQAKKLAEDKDHPIFKEFERTNWGYD